MRSLPKPLLEARAVFEACISRVQDADLRRRLQAATDVVAAEAAHFEAVAQAGNLHLLPAQGALNGNVQAREMEKVYTSRMARVNAPGRPVYDALLAAPPHGRCPLCNQRTVATLDHQLPKATHPALAVAPLNLVPACRDCNTTKLDKLPATAAEVPLHPYFDHVERDQWLQARVQPTSPAAVEFFVAPPAAWPPVLAERVRAHFSLFKLGALYASHAAEELANLQFGLLRIYDTSGAAGVRVHLRDQTDTRRAAQLNSWQTACYAALAASEWFCTGGFRAG